MVKSISYSQDEILSNIIRLYNDGKTFECDPCFSKGNFYKKIDKPKYCFDVDPKYDFVQKYDCQKLPFEDSSIQSIIFDPPFLATKGPSLNSNSRSNKINKRFGVYASESNLFAMYKNSIREFSRVLSDDGLLVIKCQDKVSSGTQYISHCAITQFCADCGFYCEDIFILLAKNRLVADWQIRNQKHSRKFHSYFMVFRKNSKKLCKVLNTMFNEG